jgi:hypothetical protein
MVAAITQISTTHKKWPEQRGFNRIDINRKLELLPSVHFKVCDGHTQESVIIVHNINTSTLIGYWFSCPAYCTLAAITSDRCRFSI